MLDLIPEKMKLDIWQWMVENFGMTGTILLLAFISAAVSIIVISAKSHFSRTQAQTAGDNANRIQISANQNQYAGDNGLFQTNSDNATVYNGNVNYTYNQQYEQTHSTFKMSPEYKGINDALEWLPGSPLYASEYFGNRQSILASEIYISEPFYLDNTSQRIVYAILSIGKINKYTYEQNVSLVLLDKNNNHILDRRPSKENQSEDKDILNWYITFRHPERGNKAEFPFSPKFMDSYKGLLRTREANFRAQMRIDKRL